MKYLITVLFTTITLISCKNSNEKNNTSTNNEKIVNNILNISTIMIG